MGVGEVAPDVLPGGEDGGSSEERDCVCGGVSTGDADGGGRQSLPEGGGRTGG